MTCGIEDAMLMMPRSRAALDWAGRTVRDSAELADWYAPYPAPSANAQAITGSHELMTASVNPVAASNVVASIAHRRYPADRSARRPTVTVARIVAAVATPTRMSWPVPGLG